MKRKLFPKKKLLGIIVASLVIFSLLIAGAGRNNEKELKAAIENAYPSQCLGGWQNPSNASGHPDVVGGTPSEENSAFLKGVSAQIFCGGFRAEEKSYPPKSVTLKLSWRVEFSSSVVLPAVDPDGEAWQEEIKQEEKVEVTPLPEPAPVEPIEVTPPPVEPVAPESSPVPPSLPPETTPAPPENPPSSFFLNTAHAEEVVSGDLLEVTYSLDGSEWRPLGKVNSANWKNFSPTLELTSWDEVERLQIAFSPIPSVDSPEIYIDGMWLEADYDKTISDVVSESADSVFDLAGAIGDAISDAVDTVVETVTDVVTDIISPEVLVIEPEKKEEALVVPLVEEKKEQVFEFSVDKTLSENVKSLSWLPSTAKKEDPSQNTNKPKIGLVNGKEGFLIEGTCDKEYYAVLLFRGKDDYLKDPSLALFNRADRCVNGSFSTLFNGKDLPPNIEDGTYYLVTADQGTRGPWVPHSEIREITLKRKTAQ